MQHCHHSYALGQRLRQAGDLALQRALVRGREPVRELAQDQLLDLLCEGLCDAARCAGRQDTMQAFQEQMQTQPHAHRQVAVCCVPELLRLVAGRAGRGAGAGPVGARAFCRLADLRPGRNLGQV
jgi:hypothetical protein